MMPMNPESSRISRRSPCAVPQRDLAALAIAGTTTRGSPVAGGIVARGLFGLGRESRELGPLDALDQPGGQGHETVVCVHAFPPDIRSGGGH